MGNDPQDVTQELLPSIRKVITYSGLDFNDVLQLPCDMFLLMLKNATIEELSRTESGREYLKKCERLKTTDIDMKGIRDFKNKGGNNYA